MTYLLLHGFTGSPASYDDLRRCLPASSRVLGPTLAGHGRAGRVAVSFDDEVTHLVRFVRAEGPVPLHVVGYSLGARLALGLCLRAPELVRRLTLVGASAGIEDPEERRARAASDDSLAALLRQQGIEAFVDRWEQQPLFSSQRELPAAERARKRTERLGHDPDALATALAALSKGRMPSLWRRLPDIQAPVELVVGELDRTFRSEAERMRALLPNATVHIVPGAGHDVGLERPAELAHIVLASATELAR